MPNHERTTHLRITPTRTAPTPERVTNGFERLHALATNTEDHGWRERLGIAATREPRIEWLLRTDGDELAYYVGAIDGPEVAPLKAAARAVLPDDYTIETVPDPLGDLGSVTDAVEFYGHPSERGDWLTGLASTAEFLDDDADGAARLPLAAIAETIADTDRPMTYQVVLSPLPDYSTDIEYVRRQCETGRLEPRDPDAPDAGTTSNRVDRTLTAAQRARLDELDAKDGRHLFTINARLLVEDHGATGHGPDEGPATVGVAGSKTGVEDSAAASLSSLTSALTACSRTGYQVAGDRRTGDEANEVAEMARTRGVHAPDYGGMTTWLPGTRDRSRGIVADASEVGAFTLATGAGLTSGGRRALAPTPGERTAVERPPDSILDTYRTPGLALGRPVNEDDVSTDERVAVPPALQTLHAAWFGGTGSGKTTALTSAILENHGATAGLDLLIDPKGDGMPTEYLRAHYAEYGDLDDVYYFDCERALPAFSFFDIRDELAAGIDRETAVEDRADHYLEILVQIMGRERFENAVRSPDVIRYLVKAAFDSVHGADAFTHRELHGMARRMHERESAPGVTDPDLERMLAGVVANRPQTFDNIMQGVANRIEKVPVDRRLARMFNHVPTDESDPEFDLAELLDEDAVVIIDTGGLRTRAQRVLALVVLSNLWTALRRRSRRVAERERLGKGGRDTGHTDARADDTAGHVGGLPLVNVYVEEAASIAVSDLLGDLLAQARGFGCGVTLAMQFPGQLREADPAAYEELLNNVSTVVTGKVPLEERFARRLATADMDASDVGNRLRALRRGRWLARLPARFGDPEPRPFQLESLPLPPGHPERDDWTTSEEVAFETARIGVRARTDAEAALTVDHASTPDRKDDGSHTADGAEGEDDDHYPDRLDRVDTALSHTMRFPEPVEYDADRHELHCRACGNRYAPTNDGMERALGCCADPNAVDPADVPICEVGLTLDVEERAATEWSDHQLLFLQAVHDAQQLRFDPPGYDIMSDSMLRLAEYVGLERDAIEPLAEADLLRHDTDHPHRLYSVTSAGREVINESARRGVDWGHNRGDLGESSEHVFLVQLGRQLLVEECRKNPESPVRTVTCYHEFGDGDDDEERRLDVVGLDDDGDPVVTLEAERINHDVRRAAPADYDKMAACDPEAAIWLVPTESAAHRVLEALNDPLGAQPASETGGDASTDPDGGDAEPRVEKTYAETTASASFSLDAAGCSEIVTMTRARKRLRD